MHRSKLLFLIAALASVSISASVFALTRRASVNDAGVASDAASTFACTTDNGRYAVFQSDATNLVAGDTNGQTDIFVRDIIGGTTERISVSTTGLQSTSYSYNGKISADGRYVAFESAGYLVADDLGSIDIYLYDRETDQLTRISTMATGYQSNANSETPSISADGRYIAYQSSSSNLVAGDTNGRRDIFVYDRVNNSNERVSFTSTGLQASNHNYRPAISPDGRYVAYQSLAALVTGDTNATSDVYIYDRQLGQTELMSTSDAGAIANGASYFYISVSSGGRYVAFISEATNLISGDTNNATDIYRYDRETDTIARVNVTTGGGQISSFYPTEGSSMSADGRYVSFQTLSPNVVNGDSNGNVDVFVRDMESGMNQRVSLTVTGMQLNGQSQYGCISPNGRYIGYESSAANIVTGTSNGGTETYVSTIMGCGDSTTQTSLGESCDDGNIESGDGCSNVCVLETPTCSITALPTSGYIPLAVTAVGTGNFGVFTSIAWNNFTLHTNGARTNVVTTGYTYTGAGNHIITGTIANPYSGSITNTCTVTINALAGYCGDSIIQNDNGEQCDDGNTDAGDGCSNICELEMPSCSITAAPAAGYIPFTTSITGAANAGGVFTGITFGDGTAGTQSNRTGTITTGHTYGVAAVYIITGTVVNPYSGSMIASCYTNVTANAAGGGPVRVIPIDNCPNGDYSSTPYDSICGTPPSSGGGSTPVSGVTMTGSQTTGSATTGFVAPDIPGSQEEPQFPLVPLFPAMPLFTSKTVDLYDRAYVHGVTTLPLAVSRPFDTVLRYEVAKMLVQFAENVMHSRIPHNPLCTVNEYKDYGLFDAEMQEYIMKSCDLGLMGRSIRNEKILDHFRPFDTLTTEELNIVIRRYIGEVTPTIGSNTRKDLWEFLFQSSLQ